MSDTEDDSINTIKDVMSNVIGTIQMVSNANAQSMNTGMTAMRQVMTTLQAEVQASRQALAHNTIWAPPPAAPAAQWTPPMTPSPNMCTPQPAPPIVAAHPALPPPQQQLGLLRDLQTSFSSDNREAVEAEGAEGEGANVVEEEAAVIRGRWHSHSIHRPIMDRKYHK